MRTSTRKASGLAVGLASSYSLKNALSGTNPSTSEVVFFIMKFYGGNAYSCSRISKPALPNRSYSNSESLAV